MPFEEKRAWALSAVTVVAYAVYLVVVIGREGPVADAPYAVTLLWSVGCAIAAAIAVEVALAATTPAADRRKDERDREIARLSEYIGQSFVVVGAVTALLLAVAETDHFWIANAVYLGFVLSALLGATAKVVAYRRGFQTW